MKSWMKLFALVCVLGLMMTSLSFAGGDDDTEIGFKADVRWRAEADGRDFNSDTDIESFSWMRFRLGTYLQRGNVRAYVQFQYPHRLDWNSSKIEPDYSVDLHQAYLKYHGLIWDGFWFKVGRMEMAYGDERLIGPVGWSNIGRVFDGVVIGHYTEMYSFDLFYTIQEERYTPLSEVIQEHDNEPDDYFAGAWFKYSPLNLHLFGLLNSTGALNNFGNIEQNFSRMTFGLHYANRYESGFSALLDGAYQMGTMEDFATATEIDLAAWMVVVKAGYEFQNGLPLSLYAGLDMTSGDDPTTPENETFNNLYYTGHKWRGSMDLFVGSNAEGLRDIFFKVKYKPMEDLGCMLAFHNFATSQDYASEVDGADATALGNEIDFEVMYMGFEPMDVSAGLGYFMAAEDWKGSDADAGLWGYLMLQTKFNAMP